MRKTLLLIVATMLSIASFAQTRTSSTRATRATDWKPLPADFKNLTVKALDLENPACTETSAKYKDIKFQDYLDDGYTLIFDFSGSYCPPCWDIHQYGVLERVLEKYENPTDPTKPKVKVFFIEMSGGSLYSLYHGAGNVKGNWTVKYGTNEPIPYPLIPTFPGSNNNLRAYFDNLFNVSGLPTFGAVAPNGVYRVIDRLGETVESLADGFYNQATENVPDETAKPDVKFDMPSKALMGNAVNCADKSFSLVDITAREWTFENGTPATSTDETVSVTWDTPGEYDVTLKVTNANGESTLTKKITIIDPASINNFHVTFEECAPYSKSIFPYEWKTVDVDKAPIYGIQDFDYPGEGEPAAFNVIDCATFGQGWESPIEGHKQIAIAIAANGKQSNDWLISPKFRVNADTSAIRFQAKSITAEWGLERFRVLVSTTTDEPAAFTEVLTKGEYVEAPTEWTEFKYSLTKFDGQEIYVAIQCVSSDAFAFMLADVEINKAVSVTGITLNPTTAEVKVNKTTQLTAIVAPEDATNKNVKWKSSDNTIATVDENGVVTGVAKGVATITATTEDGGISASCKVTVTAATSAVDDVKKTALVVYPTVVTDGFIIETNEILENSNLEIYNLLGVKVFSQKITDKKQYVNISKLANGIYAVRLNGKTSKIVKR